MRASFKVLTPVIAVAAIVAAGLSLPHVRAQEGQPAAGGGQPRREGQPGGRGQAPSVEGGMRMMNRGVNQLKGTIADAGKRDENLLAVWTIQRGCLAAKSSKPEHLEGDPEKTLETFRRGQVKLMGLLLELETAILDGKNDQAQAVFAKVAEHRDASHTALGVEMDEAGGGGGGGGGGGAGGGGGVR